MEIGVFDHLDRSGGPAGPTYDHRLRLVEAYDRLGIYCYHLAEHHATPLGVASSPNIFLSAVAQRTQRLRFAPLVYLLPFYHPLRLIEEICMLDQMSHGRIEIGAGRGISPIEAGYYGLAATELQGRYDEIYDILRAGLTGETLTYKGAHYQFDDVPMVIGTVQKPTPPFWYGVHLPDSARRAASRGFNVVTNEGVSDARAVAAAYFDGRALAPAGTERERRIGVKRFVVVAERQDVAMARGRRAYQAWYDSFNFLGRKHGRKPTYEKWPSFDACVEDGSAVAGTPDQVAATIVSQIDECGANYFIAQLAFGDLSYEESLESIELFGEIMPKLRRHAPSGT